MQKRHGRDCVLVLFLRLASAIRAENLALRKQLAAFIERGVKPGRLDHAGRVSLTVVMRQILDQAGVGASEYSWCKPPRTGFARTSASDAKR